MDSKSMLIGAYVNGALDAAVSRGELTDQAKQTLVNGIVYLYSDGKPLFPIADDIPTAVPAGQIETEKFVEILNQLADRQLKSEATLKEILHSSETPA